MLPLFDEHLQNDMVYQLLSSYLLLEIGQYTQAESRFINGFSSHLDQENLKVFVSVYELILRMTVQRTHSSLDSFLPELMIYLEDYSWVELDLKSLYATVCFYAGLIIQDQGDFEDALVWLHKSEAEGGPHISRLKEELPVLIKHALRSLACASLNQMELLAQSPPTNSCSKLNPSSPLHTNFMSCMRRFKIFECRLINHPSSLSWVSTALVNPHLSMPCWASLFSLQVKELRQVQWCGSSIVQMKG